MENIEIREATDRRNLKEFIFLPAKLHQHHINWIPPIYSDEWHYFNKNKNLAFSYCDTIILVAYVNEKPVGRIMGIINNRYNKEKSAQVARFSLFECINNQDVAHELFQTIERWSASKGMDQLIGPFGMYYHDPIGFQVEGFEHIPAISTYYNFEYIISLVENEGFVRDTGLVVYKIPVPDQMPALYNRIMQKISRNDKIRLVRFGSKKELKNYIIPVLELMNETYTDIYGFVPLDQREMMLLAKDYLPILDPSLVKIVEYDGEVAGFMIGMPNLNQGIIGSKGYLFPFGFIKIMRAAKKSKRLDLLIGAIKKKYQGIGIDVILGMSMISTAQDRGYSIIDTHLELESNYKVRAEMEKTGGILYKKYMIYSKQVHWER